MELFFFVSAISVWVAPLIVAGLILRKIDRAAKQREQPVRIYLVDFFSLTFLVQLPVALVNLTGEEFSGTILVLVVLGSATMLLVWWKTIQTVSRAGIAKVSTRAGISLLVIPMTYVGSFLIGILAINIPMGWDDYGPTGTRIANVIGELMLIGLMIISWIYTDRAVQAFDSKPDDNSTETLDDSDWPM